MSGLDLDEIAGVIAVRARPWESKDELLERMEVLSSEYGAHVVSDCGLSVRPVSDADPRWVMRPVPTPEDLGAQMAKSALAAREDALKHIGISGETREYFREIDRQLNEMSDERRDLLSAQMRLVDGTAVKIYSTPSAIDVGPQSAETIWHVYHEDDLHRNEAGEVEWKPNTKYVFHNNISLSPPVRTVEEVQAARETQQEECDKIGRWVLNDRGENALRYTGVKLDVKMATSKPCPDCKGSGTYVGFSFVREACKACGGSAVV